MLLGVSMHNQRSSVHVTTRLKCLQLIPQQGWLEPCNKMCTVSWDKNSNTERVWMEQRECASTQEVNANERSHTLQTAEQLVQENKCTQRTDGNAQTEVVFIHSFLACSLVPLHKDASNKQLTTSVALPPIMRDVSLQSIAADVDLSITLASSQNSCNVKARSSFPSAPHPEADIVSFGNDAPQAKFHPHLVTPSTGF